MNQFLSYIHLESYCIFFSNCIVARTCFFSLPRVIVASNTIPSNSTITNHESIVLPHVTAIETVEVFKNALLFCFSVFLLFFIIIAYSL